MSESGDSVRAEVNSTWIDVSVGLGRWPPRYMVSSPTPTETSTRSLTREGTVLTNPFSFEELYHQYGDSWRVARTSRCCRCAGTGTLNAAFLGDRSTRKISIQGIRTTRAVCTAAGVKAGPLLDACTLDVAVIGDDTAAKVFVGALEPVAVGKPVVSQTPGLHKMVAVGSFNRVDSVELSDPWRKTP